MTKDRAMGRADLEYEEVQLRYELEEIGMLLDAQVAREDWKLTPDTLVTDSQGREGRVTLITFPNGRQARPFVWMQRRLAGGKWQNRSRLLGDRWELAAEKNADAPESGVA